VGRAVLLLAALLLARPADARVRKAGAKPKAHKPAVSVSTAAAPAPAPRPALPAPPAPEPGPLPPGAPKGGGWARTDSSLLLYSPSGKMLHEIGLGRWEEEAEGLIVRRTMLGGVSKDGRFAWHWTKIESVQRTRVDTVVASTRAFAYLGTTGYQLWDDKRVDAPAGEAPALQSDSGETVLLRVRREGEWRVSAVDFTGNRLLRAPAGARIVDWRLTSTGRFAYFKWSHFEKPLTATFLNLEQRTQKDVPASELPPGELRLLDDGTVLAEGQPLFKL